jgi:uncharacterized protein (DUF2384 family)
MITKRLIYRYGLIVFKDKSKFRDWLESANKPLGGEKPIDLINRGDYSTIYDCLLRIDYNIYC